jgi:hypothetical protein
MDSYVAYNVENCSFGDTQSNTKVFLIGDSHATMWFPAVDYAAKQNGWNLITATKATCPPILLPIFSVDLGRNFTECETWRQRVLNRIQTDHPALVILGMARHYISAYGFTPYSPQWMQGLTDMITDIEALGSKVVVLGPVPKPPGLVPDCLSSHLYSVTDCTVPLNQAIDESGKAAEKAAATKAGASYLDPQPWFCTAQTCAVIVGNLEVWRDDNHITGTYSTFLGPVMSAQLQLILLG